MMAETQADKDQAEAEKIVSALSGSLNSPIMIYMPNRVARRRIAGRPCVYCGLALHFSDILAIEGHITFFAHGRCVQIAAQASEAEESGEKAESSTPTKEIVPDEN